MDLNFEQMLAQHNQEFKESEVYSDWMPDDGEYIASLVKLSKGTSSKDGKNSMWWRLTGRIEVEKTCPQDVQQESKIAGREFTVGYYSSRAFGILKGAVNVLSGQSIDDLSQAHAILEAALGLVVRVKIRTSRSKKDGKDYTNCFILQVINTTTETEAPADEVPVEEATTQELVETPVAPTGPDGVYAPAQDDGNAAVANGDGAIPVEVPAEAPPVA